MNCREMRGVLFTVAIAIRDGIATAQRTGSNDKLGTFWVYSGGAAGSVSSVVVYNSWMQKPRCRRDAPVGTGAWARLPARARPEQPRVDVASVDGPIVTVVYDYLNRAITTAEQGRRHGAGAGVEHPRRRT